MNGYNLCDESWISARYKTGEVRKVGLRQFFTDVNGIETVNAPVFRGDAVKLYKYVLLRFLTTIVEAAYYKKETKFAAKKLSYVEEMRETGIDSAFILRYLEKYLDRFDLYSETHPFLQNIAVREIADEKDDEYKYVFWNPFAPGANNHLFGKVRSYMSRCLEENERPYMMNNIEFAYYLLYQASIGNTPSYAFSKEHALEKNALVFIAIEGKDMCTTLLDNICPLKLSTRPSVDDPDVIADMPVWELDSVSDVKKYNVTDLPGNHLLCSFFPGISILCTKRDENGYPVVIKRTKTKVLAGAVDLSLTDALTEQYDSDSAILNVVEEDDGKEHAKYCGYDPSDTASKICMLATKSLGDTRYACGLMGNVRRDSGQRICVYYRFMDTMKVSMLVSGCMDGCNADTWYAMEDIENHQQALQYQKFYKEIVGMAGKEVARLCGKIKKDAAGADKTVLDEKIRASFRRELSEWMEDDFFGIFTDDLLAGNKALESAVGRLIDKVLLEFDKRVLVSLNFLEVVETRSKLYNTLKKKERGIVGNGSADNG